MRPTKEKILIMASDLFHRQGFNNTGINQIIQEAHVSKAGFYAHFRSKDDLCIEFLERRFEYFVSELEAYTSKASTLKIKLLISFDFLNIYESERKFQRL